MNLKRNKKYYSYTAVVFALILFSSVFLTGCVKGMTPIGWSGAIISDGTVYTDSKEGRLVSVKLADGTRKWSDPLKANDSGGLAVYGTPALFDVPASGKLVYVAGYNGKVFAYDASNLQQRWVYPVDDNLKPIISAVIVLGDTVYFGGTDGNIYALNASTGGLKWKFPTGGEIWGSPLIDNNVVFIGSFDKKVYAVDVTTGKEKWEFSTEANNVSTPIALNGIIYIGSLDRNMYAIDETSGKQIWKYTGGSWFWARPVVSNGIIYAPSLDNKVYTLDAKTGRLIAAYDVQGQVSSWPIVVNNSVIVATQNGKLWSMDSANPSSGLKLIAIIPEEVTSPLAADGDVVYINGPDNYLYSYNIATGEKVPPVPLKSL